MKKSADEKLGMNCSISRRDILHGMGAMTAGLLIPGQTSILGNKILAAEQHNLSTSKHNYPPARMGLRGNHTGSFEVAHKLGRYGQQEWGQVIDADAEVYDLVVVGAGISGLSAAHFYRKKHPKARILILDNHDDFGGHAKRNEFKVGDKTVIGYGGSQTLEEPSGYSKVVKGLLADLGVELERFEKAYDQSFYQRNGLRGGLHFDQENWGVDRIVPLNMEMFDGYLPVANSTLSIKQSVAQMPLSNLARNELIRLLNIDEDQFADLSRKKKRRFLRSISYSDFLSKHLDIKQPEVHKLLDGLVSDEGVGIQELSAWAAITYTGLPGWDAVGMDDFESSEASEPYIHHFPDGNASIARLLVRSMIPGIATGNTMEDIVTAEFNYSRLDLANAMTRLRLDSTVVKVQHDGKPETAAQVQVTYVRENQAYRVKARACVLACNNNVIPYICPELPKSQREALALQVKIPILYTSVLLANWKAWKNQGIGAVYSPGSYHVHSALDFPVSLGGYQSSAGADQPIIMHMERFPHRANEGISPKDQHRLGRHELFTTSFETIERNVRKQLVSMLGEDDFNPARDIIGITVNRWAHGYALSYSSLFDPMYTHWDDERYPHMIGRKPFGRIRIANADSDADAMFQVFHHVEL